MSLRRAQKTWPAPLASIMPTFALKPSASITVLPLFKNSTILQQSRAMRKPCHQTGVKRRQRGDCRQRGISDRLALLPPGCRIIMKLAIFDLDQTLIAGDSDRLWGEFMSERGHVDAAAQRRANAAFHQDYLAGRLDIDAFLAFQLKPLGQHRRATLEVWRAEYLQYKVKPLVLAAALDLVAEHRRQGHQLRKL